MSRNAKIIHCYINDTNRKVNAVYEALISVKIPFIQFCLSDRLFLDINYKNIIISNKFNFWSVNVKPKLRALGFTIICKRSEVFMIPTTFQKLIWCLCKHEYLSF